MIEAECYHRVVDPWTKKPVAAWGWIKQSNGLPDKYWVSIEDQPYQFFSRIDWAKEYFYFNTRHLRRKCNQRSPGGPFKRGPKPRLIKQALVATAGK